MILQVQVESVSTRKDRTYKLVLGSQELDPKQAAELFGLNNCLAYCYLSVRQIQTDIMVEIDKQSIDMVDTIKSPSKRMKSVLFLIWQNDNGGYDDFELFYRNRMELMINQLKQKL
jgi:hypothetical protein